MSYQELASSAFLSVVYRPDSGLLIGRWLCSISEAQLREGYETMRLAALEHRCRHWLMDARRRTDRRLNGPEWVVTHFLPQVQQEMGSPLCVAFLVLPNHLREVEADPTQPAQASAPGDLFQFARFIDEGVANAWLDLQRR
ncbi:MAG TPA: hypothetical protein VF629_18885 [Hymenobacter sp.]|jgi:hypothetical protein|uniref:hypothetical protein n=1 Tax=Hymenobacter sp. TaxID=1898978 RepID=UPI002ED8E4CA